MEGLGERGIKLVFDAPESESPNCKYKFGRGRVVHLINDTHVSH